MSDEKYTTIEASSTDELLAHLSPRRERFQGTKWFFRGHGDASWKLLPVVLRESGSLGEWDHLRPNFPPSQDRVAQVRMEHELLRLYLAGADEQGYQVPGDGYTFRKQAFNLNRLGKDSWESPHTWPPDDLLDVLAHAQHAGLPTRLLDWSTRSYVAAYFAARDAVKLKTANLCVWALSTTFQAVPTMSLNAIDMPRGVAPNLGAQYGAFTLLRTGDLALAHHTVSALEDVIDEATREDVALVKFTLPGDHAPDLLQALMVEGVSGATVWPGERGLTEYARDEALLREHRDRHVD